METTPEPARRPEHLWLLALAAGALIGSFVVQASPEGQITLTFPLWAQEIRLPQVCTSRWVFGVSCPGCGLTRSFAAIAQGDWRGAFRCNPMGPVLFIVCVAQLPYRLMEYYGLGRSVPWWVALKAKFDLVTWFVVAGLVGQWVVRLIGAGMETG